jgi:hypothetical protein
MQLLIRPYRPRDEQAQVEIYNAATAGWPGFKAAAVEEVARRYSAADFDPDSKLYAERDGRVAGYITFSANGRISAPWCLPDAMEVRGPLLDSALAAMKRRGIRRCWAAYRADWLEVRSLLESLGFRVAYEMINFVAAPAQLPHEAAAGDYRIEPLHRDETKRAYELDPAAFGVTSPDELAAAWWDGPYLSGGSIFALRDASTQRIAAVGLAVIHPHYADPTKIDSAMPCFRLGTIGTESERTKRVNGLFSFATAAGRPTDESHHFARLLLGEACHRFERASVVHVAAQCRSDRPVERAFYDRYFQRQQSFPVFAREL